MKIRTTLTLEYTGITAVLLLLMMFAIYGLSEWSQSRNFFQALEDEAEARAHLYLDGLVDSTTMQAIYQNNTLLIDEVEVAIYESDGQVLYQDNSYKGIVQGDSALIESVLRDQQVELVVGKYQAIGILHEFGGRQYVVTAAACDSLGQANLAQLTRTLLLVFALGLLALFVTGYLILRNALKPIRRIVQAVGRITASRIGQRLPVKNRDELGELGLAFNALLERLQVSFEAQKTFVGNVSHELRTPLAALIAEIDLALQRERPADEYRQSLSRVLGDARRMTSLIEGLLNLARADYRREEISMQPVRLDELLLDVREPILKAHPDYQIELVFAEEYDDERAITVQGNRYLLGIAFSNLMDNNCKYSNNKTSCVQIASWKSVSIIRFSDNGSGISEQDMRNLFTPFHRGQAQQHVEGHGIGMALTQKVVRLHGGSIDVRSSPGEGTTYVIELPHI